MDKNQKGEKLVKSLVVSWNHRKPLDRWWRERYKIPFNSSSHREVSYIDIVLEYQESVWVEEYRGQILQREEDRKDFENTGKVFKDSFNNIVNSQEESSLFDKIKF